MTLSCIRCGANDSVKELDMSTADLSDFANIYLDLMEDAKSHVYNVLYDLPPWLCESCKTIYLRVNSGRKRKDTENTCRLCGKGNLNEFENVEIGIVVIKGTEEKLGNFTVDEAVVCDNCGYMTPIETGVKIE